MPFKARMEDGEYELSVINVYEIASEIGKEVEKIIDSYGPDAVTGFMPKVINALEHLEVLATKNERENMYIQNLEAKILKLENDKLEKQEERFRYERELESIEEHWRKETQDWESLANNLQEENRRLKNALAAKQDLPSQQMTPEVDIAAMTRLRGMIDKLRDNLRKSEREISVKNSTIDELTSQVKKLTNIKKDLSRKFRFTQNHTHILMEELTDMCIQNKDQERKYKEAVDQLAEATSENTKICNAYKYACPNCHTDEAQKEDPNRPRFTAAEMKEILQERNTLKAQVSDLEDELATYRPKEDAESPLDEDLTVQGPLPYEPDDAPWKKNDSGIRRFFRKLFSDSNVTFLGSSPKRSLSSLSKITLSGGASVDTSV